MGIKGSHSGLPWGMFWNGQHRPCGSDLRGQVGRLAAQVFVDDVQQRIRR